jgi:hypothetical protein
MGKACVWVLVAWGADSSFDCSASCGVVCLSGCFKFDCSASCGVVGVLIAWVAASSLTAAPLAVLESGMFSVLLPSGRRRGEWWSAKFWLDPRLPLESWVPVCYWKESCFERLLWSSAGMPISVGVWLNLTQGFDENCLLRRVCLDYSWSWKSQLLERCCKKFKKREIWILFSRREVVFGVSPLLSGVLVL